MIFQYVVGFRPLFPWWPCTNPCCVRKPAYHPSTQHNWRVWGFWVSKLLNSPSYNFNKQQILQKNIQFTCKNSSIWIKPIQTLSTLTCAISMGTSHLDILIWKEFKGSKERIPVFMWNPVAPGTSMGIFVVWSYLGYLLWYHVNFN